MHFVLYVWNDCSAYMHVCSLHAWLCPQRSEDGVGSLEFELMSYDSPCRYWETKPSSLHEQEP